MGLFGWNPPHREDPNCLAESSSQFMQHEVLTLEDMLLQFNLDKISKIPVTLNLNKLEYLNAQHIKEMFNYTPGNIEEISSAVTKFRALLL